MPAPQPNKLTIFRRHSKSCPHAKDPSPVKCSCPLWVHGRVDGSPLIRKPLNTRSLGAAEERRNAMLKHPQLTLSAEPKAKKEKAPKESDGPDKYHVRSVLRSFLQSRRDRNCTMSTIRSYESILEQFLEKARSENITDIRRITEELVLSCCGSEYTVRTRAGRRIVFRIFFGHAVKRGLIQKTPLSEESFGRNRGPKGHAQKAFSTGEINRMFDALAATTPYARALFLLMLHSGLRIVDAVFLRRGSVDFATGALNIKPIKSRCAKPISMELPAKVLDALREADKGGSNFLFLPEGDYSAALLAAEKEGDFLDAMPMNTVAVRHKGRRALRTIFEAAGIPEGEQKPHRLRSTFATHLIRSGVDIFTVSQLLGHSSVVITEKAYLAVLTEHRAKMAKVTRALDFTREPEILLPAA